MTWQALIESLRSQVVQADLALATRLETLYLPVLVSLQREADRLGASTQALQDQGVAVTPSVLLRVARLDASLELIGNAVSQYAATASTVTQGGVRQSVSLAQDSAQRLLEGTRVGLTRSQLESVPPAFRYFKQSAVADILAKYSGESPYLKAISAYPSATQQLVQTVFIDQVTQGVGGRAAARELREQLGLPRVAAQTTARTAMMASYRDTTLAQFRANRDVVRQWRWTATKGTRTCPACLFMDGRRFDLDVPFGSHPNCRCTPVPVTATWQELGIDLPEQDLPYETGEEWFRTLSREKQTLIVGKGGIEAINLEGYSLRDFVGYHTNDFGPQRYARSLKQIKSGVNIPTSAELGS